MCFYLYLMMKLLLFELKKTICTKQFGLCLLALVLLNIFYFSYTLKTSLSWLYDYDSNIMIEKYHELHKQYDGKLNIENAQAIISKYNELDYLISNQTYSTEFREDTITGLQFSDYVLLRLFFYEPMQYIAQYKDNNEELVQQAKENLQTLTKGTYQYKLNEFFISHYEGRSLSQFHKYEGWEAVFNYQFSELLMIIILMLGLLPTMIDERKNGMSSILQATRIGYKKEATIKIYVVLIVAAASVFMFSMLNLIIAHLWIGLSGSSNPIYSLSSFSQTLFSNSIIQVYLFSLVCKVIGLFIFGLILLGISKYSKDYLVAFIVSIVTVIVLLYISGYSGADFYVLQVISTFSPFTLIDNLTIFQKYIDIVVFHNIYAYVMVAVIIQIIIGYILILILKKKRKRRRICFSGR